MAMDMTNSRKVVPQRGCGGDRWPTRRHRIPGFVGMDRLVFGAVIAEHPPDVREKAMPTI